jgi:hypothetical protein
MTAQVEFVFENVPSPNVDFRWHGVFSFKQ